MFEIKNLRVEYKRNPMGMDEQIPRFSYDLDTTVKKPSERQSAYRITVRISDTRQTVWDSGKVLSGLTQQIEYQGVALKAFTRYDWSVEVWDEKDVSSKSAEKAFFETGFLNAKWDAKWLSCAWGGSTNPLSRFLRDFKLTGKVKKARLYATALGTYDVYVNGVPVGDDCLKPGWTDYYERVQYQAFDVTNLLRKGENTLAAGVADGWYVCKGYGKCPMFIAELHIEMADGTTTKIVTDKDWRAFYIHIGNPMPMSHLYYGETYDAWQETTWKLPGGEREYAVPAREQPMSHPILSTLKIVWQSGPNMKRMVKMTPISITKRPNATYLVDFGQNFAGREQIRLKNTMQGTTIVIKHGEMLNPDGSLYVKNLRTALQRTIYSTGTNAEEIYEPLYTFCGFRYLEISGWPGKLTKDQVCAHAIYSDLDQIGSFHCSEDILNKLYSNIVWGPRSNFVDVPTDCPQRDERQGWTGDTQVFANMATYNMNCGDFYTKWIEDLNLAQSRNGAYPYIAPRVSREIREEGAAGWSDAGIICPEVMFTKYADTRVIRKYFRKMCQWIDWQIQKAGGSLIVNNATFGDWLNANADTDREYISTAYMAGMIAKLADMAKCIGEKSEQKRLETLFADVKRAFCEKYFSAAGKLAIETQTAAVFALHFDLCPNPKAQAKTLAWLKRDIVETRKLHLSTGFLGTPLLLKTLTKMGDADLAYDLLMQTTYPGWLYPVTQGATTMWERWNSWTEKDGFCDPEMNSFNHYAYGAVGDWFFETICGIQPNCSAPENAGFKKFTLAPEFGHRLNSAEVSFRSAYGVIKSAWKRIKGKVMWNFTVPCNASATVRLPKGFILAKTPKKTVFCVTPGDYSLELTEKK